MNNKKNEKERKKKWNEKLRNFVRCIKLCCEVETLLKEKKKKKNDQKSKGKRHQK